LWPSVGVWLLVPVMAGAALVSLLPVGTAVAVVGAVAVALALAAWAVLASPTIAVVDGELVAGRARVPVTLLGRSLPARGPDARQQRGPELDARAFLLIRGWVDPVLKVELVDPDDPTPYWLLSTRRPEALAEAVETAQAGTRPSPDAGR
jgi:Protein of unknown function (DUF3093)